MNQNLIINATDSHLEAIRKLNENRAPLIDNLVPLEHLPAFRVDDEHALQRVVITEETSTITLQEAVRSKSQLKINFGNLWLQSSTFELSSDGNSITFTSPLSPFSDGSQAVLEIYFSSNIDLESFYNITDIYEEIPTIDTANNALVLSSEVTNKESILIIYGNMILPSSYFEIDATDAKRLLFTDTIDPSVDITIKHYKGILVQNQASSSAFSFRNTEIINENLLMNSNFKIWQRGETFNNISSNSYCADRWLVIHDNANVNISKEDGIKISTDKEVTLFQFVDLSNKTYTVSVDSSSNTSYKLYVDGDITNIESTFTVPDNVLVAAIGITVEPGTHYINSVKLEESDHATQYISPADELYQCQRYYRRFSNKKFIPYGKTSSNSYFHVELHPEFVTNNYVVNNYSIPKTSDLNELENESCVISEEHKQGFIMVSGNQTAFIDTDDANFIEVIADKFI